MEALIASILRLGSEALATEEAACAAVAALRFPNGLSCRCGASCTRTLAVVTCARKHRFTILVDTPFGSKRRPRVRALLLAIRAFALSTRSISARELARDVDMPHVTLWRHLMTMRSLLPPPSAHATKLAAATQVCGRRSSATDAWVRAGARVALDRSLEERGANRRKSTAGRLVAESFRATLVGTFHGVSWRYLRAYLDEARTRWRIGDLVIELLVERVLTVGSAPVSFSAVQKQFR